MMNQTEQFGEPEYLGWSLLVHLKDQSSDQISRSKFLKLCCITNRYLLEKHDYDVGLPRYWYIYGELANQHEFSGRFFNAPKAIGWEGQQYLPKSNITFEDFDISIEARECIDTGVKWAINKFGRSNVEEIKQHQYSEQAPHEFIQIYSELRWQLKTIDLNRQQRLGNYTEKAQSNERFLRQQLDRMVETYPKEDFDEMYSLFLRWDDTIRLMLDQSPDYGELEECLDDFIKVLSKVVLRFGYRRNISEQRLSEWHKDAAMVKSTFERNLREKRRDRLRNRDRTANTGFEAIADVFSETVRDDVECLYNGR
jgi:hypothetical protein